MNTHWLISAQATHDFALFVEEGEDIIVDGDTDGVYLLGVANRKNDGIKPKRGPARDRSSRSSRAHTSFDAHQGLVFV